MPVTLDFSKAQPLQNVPQQNPPVTLDFSKAVPLVPPAPLPQGLQGPPSEALKIENRIAAPLANYGIGVGKGIYSRGVQLDSLINSVPLVGPLLESNQALAKEKALAVPRGTAQNAGFGTERAGEFLVPGLGEERAVAGIGEAAPKLLPFARIWYNALTTGAINKSQGGGFVTGALAGGVGGGATEGLKALAPHIAESALGVRKLDRAYGRGRGSIGRAALNETRGFTPANVAASAQSRLDELNPMLENAADRVSSAPFVRPRGLLNPPADLLPLGEPTADMIDVPGQLVNAKRLSSKNIYGGSPDPRNVQQLGNRATLPPARLTRNAFMTGTDDTINDLNRSGPGVWIRRPAPSAPPEFPDLMPLRSASLSPARAILSDARGKAVQQGERTTLNQLLPMQAHLSQTVGGEPIQSAVTPRQLLNLKRGFGNEFIHRWNPETMTGVKGTAANVYHALNNEFERTVPQAKPLNQRISRLILISKRAASEDLNAPMSQRIFHRFGAHTGALTGAVGGGYAGYREKGVPGAIGGALLGVAVPEMIASPTGEMAAARLFSSPVPSYGSKAAIGSMFGLSKPHQSNKQKK